MPGELTPMEGPVGIVRIEAIESLAPTSFSLGNRFLPDSSYLARSLFPEQLGALQVSSAISGFYDSYDSHSRAASLGSSRR